MVIPNGHTLLKTIDLYYTGWDCDSKCYIVEDQSGKRYALGTDHGRPVKMKISDLGKFMKDYKEALKDTREAINILQGGKYE